MHAYACEGIVTEAAVLAGHAVVIDEGRVVALCRRGEVPSSVTLVDLPGVYLAPGFVDLHVHGAAGHGYHEADAAAAAEIGAALLSAGVTTALPTLASAPIQQLTQAIPRVLAASGGPRLPGVQLEGPYFSPAQAGAQDRSALRQPDDGSLPALLEFADDIAIVSLAPELPGATEAIATLAAAGIVVAAGHSDGTAADLACAQRHGLSHVTHVFSGQSSVRRDGPWRIPGMLEATLASDHLSVEIIADGRHLPPQLMQIAHRCLKDRLCLVSDASPGAGLPDGSSYRMAGHEYVVEGGVGMTLDRTSFGGSATLLGHMLPIVRDALGLSVPDMIAMATAIPARAARLDSVGSLVAGNWADLTLLDKDLRLLNVALGGTWLKQVSSRV